MKPFPSRWREAEVENDARNRTIDVERWEWEHLHCVAHWREACPDCKPVMRIKTDLVWR